MGNKKDKIKKVKIQEVDDLLLSGAMQPGVESLFSKPEEIFASVPIQELPPDPIQKRPSTPLHSPIHYPSQDKVGVIGANIPVAANSNFQTTPVGMARKYFAYDVSRVSFWCKEIQDKQYITQHGPTLIAQETGFDCVIADLIMCTTDQLLECAPRGDIRLGNSGKVEDVKSYFYGISLDRPLDKSYKLLPLSKKQAALSFFVHCLAIPKHMNDGTYRKCMPKGAEKAGLGALVETEFPGVAFLEVPIGTPNSYDPNSFQKPQRMQRVQQVGYMTAPIL